MATRHSPSRFKTPLLMPEDISGRILDFDPGYAPSVFSDVAGSVVANVGDAVAAMSCLVSGMLITQSTVGNRFSLAQEGSYRRLEQPNIVTRFLTISPLPTWLPSKLKAPLTISWWVKPSIEPVGGSPLYQWEFYNTAEAGIHLNFQYSDPNDASNEKRFIFSRRRSDTTGVSQMIERVDNGIFPTSDVGSKWIMLTMVNEGDPIDLRIRGYFNGVQYDILTGIASMYQGLSTNAGFWLGCRNVTGNFARSSFRRFTIWERALSPGQIHALYRTTRDAWGLA